jgi:16S rRNA (guanine966-N2)-methyltransferase
VNLRIIGGTFKNRPLKSSSNLLTKPTTAILRKAVFDICQNKIQGASVLDLFACSGAIGLEALSRGASHVTFVENDRKTAKILQENILAFGVKEQTRLLIDDVFTVIHKPFFPNLTYDIIYIDPPYPLIKAPQSPIPALLHFLDTSPLLAPGCTVFFEEGAPASSITLSRLQHKSTRRFGESILQEFVLP